MTDTSRRISQRNWLARIFGRRQHPTRTPVPPDSRWFEAQLQTPRTLTYRLFVPSDLAAHAPAPLLVMLHGCNQTALEFAEGTRMNALAEQHHCLVLYPQQSKVFNTLRCWNWFDPETLAGRGEVNVIVRAVQYCQQHYPVDARRIYVAGLSAGGALSAVLCARHPELFAGCAIHSGLMYRAAESPIDAYRAMRHGAADAEQLSRAIAAERHPGARAVPTLVIHGANDATVSPVNARQILQQLQWVADSEAQPERSGAAGGRSYRLQDYQRQGALLARSLLVDELDHAWSGGDPRHPYFDAAGPDASSLMLEFLLAQRLEG